MPITPFMGVRISWLMLARKLDLATDAAGTAHVPMRSTLAASGSSTGAPESSAPLPRRAPTTRTCHSAIRRPLSGA
jgi:hypothetical protein